MIIDKNLLANIVCYQKLSANGWSKVVAGDRKTPVRLSG